MRTYAFHRRPTWTGNIEDKGPALELFLPGQKRYQGGRLAPVVFESGIGESPCTRFLEADRNLSLKSIDKSRFKAHRGFFYPLLSDAGDRVVIKLERKLERGES